MPRVYNAATEDYPATAVHVARPTRFGNPYRIGKDGTREEVIAKYERFVRADSLLVAIIRRELKGKDLVCWCSPKPCHAAVLMCIANEAPAPGQLDAERMAAAQREADHWGL